MLARVDASSSRFPTFAVIHPFAKANEMTTWTTFKRLQQENDVVSTFGFRHTRNLLLYTVHDVRWIEHTYTHTHTYTRKRWICCESVTRDLEYHRYSERGPSAYCRSRSRLRDYLFHLYFSSLFYPSENEKYLNATMSFALVKRR